jgi:hypothetical protein
MEFPITKNRLQNISDELYLIHIKKYISETVEYLTNEIFKAVVRSPFHKNLQIPINSISVNYNPEIMMIIMRNKHTNRIQIMDHITEILNTLQERFPDTVICLDPMKTYFFIDWS